MYSAEITLGERQLRIETGHVAKQAAGSCMVSYGETVLLVSASYRRDINESVDFLPLTVDYRELLFAAGKIPGGFIKREGRLSENEILTCRLIDRPLRTLFPDHFRNEVQIIANLLSSDVEHEADTLGIIGAATALLISEIPYTVPLAAVKIGLKDGSYIINPGISEQDSCNLNLVIAGTKENIIMIEGGANECSEQEVVGAIEFAQPQIRRIIEIEKQIQDKVGNEKIDMIKPFVDKTLEHEINQALGTGIDQIYDFKEKQARQEAIYQLVKRTAEKFEDRVDDIEKKIMWVVDDVLAKKMRLRVFEDQKHSMR
jgi:polyribonucleotide nucleotidyltransferase